MILTVNVFVASFLTIWMKNCRCFAHFPFWTLKCSNNLSSHIKIVWQFCMLNVLFLWGKTEFFTFSVTLKKITSRCLKENPQRLMMLKQCYTIIFLFLSSSSRLFCSVLSSLFSVSNGYEINSLCGPFVLTIWRHDSRNFET